VRQQRETHERDERWAYVALVVLAVAFVAYLRFGINGRWGFALSGVMDLRDTLREFEPGKLFRSLPYVFAPLFAVLSEIYRRRRAKAMRAEWEQTVRAEGFLRQQENVEVRYVEGGSGKLQGDVRLTRVALYVIDRSWRRGPSRLVFEPSPNGEPVIQDVSLAEGKSPERRRVRIRVGGSSDYVVEFLSSEAEAWMSDLIALVRRRGMATAPKERRTQEDTYGEDR
jgi:hypothetical protein